MRYRRAVGGLFVAVVGVYATALPANAANDATHAPTHDGPLISGETDCFSSEMPDGSRTQACSWWFDLVPAETNPLEDYHAYWFQFELDPGPRSCARGLSFYLAPPESARIVSATPAKSRRVGGAAVAVTRLTVDAEGGAPLPASVENELREAPGRLNVRHAPDGYAVRWQGSVADKIVLAVGIQLAGKRIPPEILSRWFEANRADVGPCTAPERRSGR